MARKLKGEVKYPQKYGEYEESKGAPMTVYLKRGVLVTPKLGPFSYHVIVLGP